MKKRYLPITVTCGILAVFAVTGLFLPAPSEELPTRLRMDNKGGAVLFTHARHVQYVEDMGENCTACHHDTEHNATAEPLPCGSCHATEFNAQFSSDHQNTLPESSCTQCHHAELGALNFDHDTHASDYASDCTDCHHGPDIEPEPMACSECHGENPDGAMPNNRDAVHARCQSCHENFYEEKLEGCASCHTLLPGTSKAEQPTCASCHFEEKGTPLPTRMDSFHDQCMDCHEKAGKGPFGEKSCSRCHTR